jgi:hypothetical protein
MNCLQCVGVGISTKNKGRGSQEQGGLTSVFFPSPIRHDGQKDDYYAYSDNTINLYLTAISYLWFVSARILAQTDYWRAFGPLTKQILRRICTLSAVP